MTCKECGCPLFSEHYRKVGVCEECHGDMENMLLDLEDRLDNLLGANESEHTSI
jgi:hypothetical protein